MSNLQAAIPVVKVLDLPAAQAFYVARLGFTREFHYQLGDDANPGYMGIARDGARLHVSSFGGDGVLGSVVHLVVADVDALHAELTARETPIALAPTDQDWGVREMHVADPWGNRLRFGQPLG